MPLIDRFPVCQAAYEYDVPENESTAVFPTTAAVPLAGEKSKEYEGNPDGGIRHPPSVTRTESKEKGVSARKVPENELPVTFGLPFIVEIRPFSKIPTEPPPMAISYGGRVQESGQTSSFVTEPSYPSTRSFPESATRYFHPPAETIAVGKRSSVDVAGSPLPPDFHGLPVQSTIAPPEFRTACPEWSTENHRALRTPSSLYVSMISRTVPVPDSSVVHEYASQTPVTVFAAIMEIGTFLSEFLSTKPLPYGAEKDHENSRFLQNEATSPRTASKFPDERFSSSPFRMR